MFQPLQGFVDAVNAFTQALKFKKKNVALLYPSFDDFEFDFKALADFVGINIVQLSYNSIWDLENKITDLKRQGISLLIGTTLAVSICKNYGINGIEIYSIESIVYASIDKAIEVVKAIRKKQSDEILRDLIINNVHEGIVYIDEFGKIHIFNDEAVRLFNLQELPVIGKHIDEIVSNLNLMNTLMTGITEINSIEVIKNINLTISRIPIKVNHKIVGVVATFQNTQSIEDIGDTIRKIKKSEGFTAKYTFDDLIGENQVFLSTIDLSKKYARSDMPILVEGETGTGKELFAQSIHNYSYRKNYPFVAINCASLSENLLESELFGYEPGSFTGASSNGKKGLFQIADGGTLFLDEINSIPKSFQAKLLRAIEEKEIIRIGGTKIIPVDVRIIASSNVSIKSMIDKGDFREDLYYRIGILKIRIPPLRDRMGDLPYLIEELANDINLHKNYDFHNIYNKIWEKLINYDFYGNVRELIMFLNRFFILLDINQISNMTYIDDLIDFCVDEMYNGVDNHSSKSQKLSIVQENERKIILKLLDEFNNNKTLVAKHMEIGRNTLYRKMKELGIKL